MMKKMKSLWALLPVAVALIVASCSSEDAAEPASGNNSGTKTIPVTITVGMDNATRATVGSDNSTLYFHSADKLAVLFGGSLLGKLDMTVNNGTTATFEGTVTSTGDFSGSYNEVTVVLIGDENIGVRESDGTWVNNGPAICVANGNSSALNEAVKKYSYLTGTGTLGPGNLNNFTLTQHTAFLNIAVTFKDETAANTNLSVTVTNNNSMIGTGTVTTETDATSNDVVAKFVVPVAAGTTMNGTTIEFTDKDPIVLHSTATLEGQSYRIEKTIDGVEAVQLWEGGPYWATMNVGATSPKEYGKYFAWGETEGYAIGEEHYFALEDRRWEDDFDGDGDEWNARWLNAGVYEWDDRTIYIENEDNIYYLSGLTKYVVTNSGGYRSTIDSDPYRDNLATLESEDDAATANWGNGWRMPTIEDVESLLEQISNGTVTATLGEDDYTIYRIFRGTGDYASHSIILPLGNKRQGDDDITLGKHSYGYYWTSSLPTASAVNMGYGWIDTDSRIAYSLNLSSIGGTTGRGYIYRWEGCNVRPVRDTPLNNN